MVVDCCGLRKIAKDWCGLVRIGVWIGVCGFMCGLEEIGVDWCVVWCGLWSSYFAALREDVAEEAFSTRSLLNLPRGWVVSWFRYRPRWNGPPWRTGSDSEVPKQIFFVPGIQNIPKFKRRKTDRWSWVGNNMKIAMDRVVSGELTMREAATRYDVLKSTLQNRSQYPYSVMVSGIGMSGSMYAFKFTDEVLDALLIYRRGGVVRWPACAFDLTPLDFFPGRTLKGRVYNTVPTTPEDMQEHIVAACRGITPEIFHAARRSLHMRL
ncbi:hypothetical protein PR048_012224 [Dryococelus australis]|uniref:HTH psq-type domain-containing protein n=1 Tax=Dryococelus australis TaxID=614101 RepID=A0ABQ9HNS5_9NEOP|nr:hypothetical protein PR048_012224 [Dryococelus australis]